MAYGFSVSAQDAAYSAYYIAAERAGGRNPFLAGGSSSSASASKSSRSASAKSSAQSAAHNTSVKNRGTGTSASSTNVTVSSGNSGRASGASQAGRVTGSSTKNTYGAAIGSVRKTTSHSIKNDLLRSLDRQDFSVAEMTGEQKKKANFAYTGTTADKKNGYLDFWSKAATSTAEEEKSKAAKYNYKDVSSEIQRAKTSSAAGSVVIKAKRKVQEIKRKMVSGNGDVEELAMALTHAKRMERVAKKKQHHLELEELVARKQSGQMPDEQDSMKADAYAAEEERLSDAQYELEGEQQKALEEYLEETGLADDGMESTMDGVSGMAGLPGATGFVDMGGFSTFSGIAGMNDLADITAMSSSPDMPGATGSADMTTMTDTAAVSDDLTQGLTELLEDFGSEEQEMLEEMQEQLALLETVDPDMSEEDLKELKMKHRQSERRDIVKADMDYLKSVFEHYEKKREKMLELAKASMPGAGKETVAGIAGAGAALHAAVSGTGAATQVTGFAASASAAADAVGAYTSAGGFDISI